jgi:glycosyltransferase involved in cell wall biosynthesis
VFYKTLLKQMLKPFANPILDRIAVLVQRRIQTSLVPPKADISELSVPPPTLAPTLPVEELPFEVCIISLARALAASGGHEIIIPTDAERRPKNPKQVRIGFFGNLANNAYNFTKCIRRLGYDAELVIEDGWFDLFLMNRPFWEDVAVESCSYEEGLTHEHKWSQPAYVRRVAFDAEMQMKYQKRYSAIPEVQAEYKKAFGIELAPDRALLLAQHMGHWPYILAMRRYDVIQFSGAPISMGAFCPKPYVVYPTGSDLFISPFEESLFGLLMRAGYRAASKILYAGTNYKGYLDRLGPTVSMSFAPTLIDTDVYKPVEPNDYRLKWQRRVGGSKFILCACRQNWLWKRNDIFIALFANYLKKSNDPDWRLVLQAWGPDIERSKKLISELKIEDRVLWERLCSKPALFERLQAADVVADQFAMQGYGTSVLEAMAAAKPILIRFSSREVEGYFPTPPPFLSINSEEDLFAVLNNSSWLRESGRRSREWLLKNHGYEQICLAKYLLPLIAAGGGSLQEKE